MEELFERRLIMNRFCLFITVPLLFLADASVLHGQPRASNDLRPVYVASDIDFDLRNLHS